MPDEFELDFDVSAERELPPMEIGPSTGPLSATPIALNLVPYQQEVALFTQQAKSIKVSNAATLKQAVEAKVANKKLWKKLEEKRNQVRRPYLDHLSEIQNIFKALQDPLLANETLLNTEQGRYEHKLLLERRAEEARLREEQRQLQVKLEAEAKAQREEAERKAIEAQTELDERAEAGTLDPATQQILEQTVEEEMKAALAPTPQVAPIMASKPEVVRTAGGASFTKFVWKGRIEDESKVPREYCSPDQKLIDAAVKAGIRNIEGVVIEEVPIPVTKI